MRRTGPCCSHGLKCGISSDRRPDVCLLKVLFLTLVLTSCTSLPLLTGRIESLDSIADGDERRGSVTALCGDVSVKADYPSEEIRNQARVNLEHLCALHNKEEDGSGSDGIAIISAELRERSVMKDLKLRRSVSLILTVTDDEGEYLARYICGTEGKGSAESAPWLYLLLARGFRKLFP